MDALEQVQAQEPQVLQQARQQPVEVGLRGEQEAVEHPPDMFEVMVGEPHPQLAQQRVP